eukprot:TRINITY_DN9939_c0_g2_i3.p1 TRINITY_DN9939_c0_g2~~TRINITY_DN9939_c0_g2_i3.p1  ORF type:complete len:217 (-),score=39.44 TRINITY_DN9939_c0_g2_i3:5-655(-)
MSLNDIIVLDVGGTRFKTSRGTLVSEPDSMLAKMFDPDSPLQPAKTQEGAYFLDRDPDTFTVILSYLRSAHISKSCHGLLDKLMVEAQYFQLASLQTKIQEMQSNNESDTIGFNINGSNYIACIERKYFGNVPFDKIVEAVEGSLDKDGNITIFPGRALEMREKEYRIRNELDSKESFVKFATAVKFDIFYYNNHGRYTEFSQKIIGLKKRYATNE